MEWYTILSCCIIGIITALYFYITQKFSYWKDRGVTYLEPRIPLGNIPTGQTQHIKELLAKFYKIKDGSRFVGGFFFTTPIIVVTDLDFAKDILIRDFNKFTDHGLYMNERDDPLSVHLFSLDGQKWRSLRAKLTPTFTSGKMKFMFPTIVEVSEQFNKMLGKMLKVDSIVEIKDILARFTTDIIGTCAFGIECNSLKDPNADFRKYGRKHFEEPTVGTFGRAIMRVFPQLARLLRLKLTRDDVTEFFVGIVRETVEYREKNNVRRNDFMDLLIQLKNNESLDSEGNILGKLSLEEIAAQAFLFFLGGFETSSTTLSYVLYELARNQDVQEKAREEVKRVLHNHNDELTYDAMMNMPYLDQIITEALRMYPPVVAIFRKAVEDHHIPDTNITIEKGTTVLIPAYSIQHDPDIFPEPEIFDPDRYSPDQVKNRHPMSFLSFGEGPRNCIGLRFGKMQARIGLAMLLRNYRFKTCPKTAIPIIFSNTNLILTAEGGLYLKFEQI